MFDFLKNTADLEWEFREWLNAELTRMFGSDWQTTNPELKIELGDSELVWHIEQSVVAIAIHSKDAQIGLSFTGSVDAPLDRHFKHGANIINLLCKKRGWAIAITELTGSGRYIVVDIASGKRVPNQ